MTHGSVKSGLVLAALVAGHAALVAVLTMILGNSSGFVAGAVLAGPMLYGAWAALGPSALVHRVPWALLACVAASFAGAGSVIVREERLGSALGGTFSRGGEFADVVLFFILVFALFAAVALLLWPLRPLLGCQIGHCLEDGWRQRQRVNQFTVRYLLGWTTATACACSVACWLFPSALKDSPRWADILSDAAGVARFFAVVLLPMVPIPLAVLARGRYPFILGAAVLALWVGYDAFAIFAHLFAVPGFVWWWLRGSGGGLVTPVQLAAVTTALAMAGVLRLCGYRFGRYSRETPPELPPPTGPADGQISKSPNLQITK